MSCKNLLLLFQLLFLTITEFWSAKGQIYYVSTLSGTGTAGGGNGAGTVATFSNTEGVCADSSGNVYATEYSGQRIRKIAPTGMTTLVAGTGTAASADGSLTSAGFNTPTGCVFDSAGNMFVADRGNQLIRKITFSTGLVSVFAGSAAAAGFNDGFRTYAQFNGFYGICADSSNNIYVPDTMSNNIRKITSLGQVTKIAGTGSQAFADGPASSASFNWPCGCAVDNYNSRLYISDTYNQRIRYMPLSGTLTVTTLSGTGSNTALDGSVTSATYYYPIGAAVNSQQALIIGDAYNYRVRRIYNGVVTTIAGTGTPSATDGFGTVATFGQPRQVAVDSNDNVFVADYAGNKVRKITHCSGGATFDLTLRSCVCAAGSQLNPNNTCSSCQDGYFRSSSGNLACTQCPAGTQTAVNRQSCTTCPAGLYRDLIMSTCQSCPLGSEILLNQTGCATCTYGRVRTSSMSSCSDCSIGFEASADKSSCVPCASGYYRPSSDYLKCVPCPPFATCSASAITVCSVGYKINADGTGCEQCPVGTQSSGDFLSCVGCTVGTNYRSSLTQSSCQSCPLNSTCLNSSGFTCNAGYEPTSDGTGCQACAEGYSKSGSGNTACTQCAAGSESAAYKQSCSACTSGKYRPNTSTNKCIPCPQNGACSASVLTCNAGYKLNSNGDGCDQCPLGQQSNAGFTACVSCSSGTNYRSSLVQSSCQACPSNSACTTTGFTCDAGYELIGDGTGCQQCAEGYSKSASGNSACTQCAIGTESAANKQSCTSCASGFYRPNTSYNKCITCPLNGICSASALTRCSNGFVLNSNGDGCDQCPLGQDSSDGINCQGCAVGYFKPDQSYTTCVACPQGVTSCGGSGLSCQAGYYFDSNAQCKRNDTYFALFQTATSSAVTVTAFVTLTQTQTQTQTATATSTTSVFVSTTQITQTAFVTAAASSISVAPPPVTVPVLTVSLTVISTETVPNTVTPVITFLSTAVVSSSTVGSSSAEQLNISIDGIGTLPVSPVVFGLLAFIIGVLLMVLVMIICCRKSSSVNKKDDDDYFPAGMTTTSGINTTSQRTFTQRSFR